MKPERYSLADLLPGQQGCIVELAGHEPNCRRLQEMGLTHGTLVRLLGIAPLGDPLQILVRGYHLCIRKSEARGILVHAS